MKRSIIFYQFSFFISIRAWFLHSLSERNSKFSCDWSFQNGVQRFRLIRNTRIFYVTIEPQYRIAVTQYFNYFPARTRIFAYKNGCNYERRSLKENLKARVVFRTEQVARATKQLIDRSIGHGRAISSLFLLQQTNFYGVLYRRMRQTYRRRSVYGEGKRNESD